MLEDDKAIEKVNALRSYRGRFGYITDCRSRISHAPSDAMESN